jgi:phosphoglycolate phosphatase
MAVRTAIFDFDGTVADTFEQVVAVLNELAPEFNYRTADAAEVEVLRGLPPPEVAQRLELPWHKVPLLVARVRSELSKRMGRVRPCSGVPEALRRLRAEGVTLGLLTSNNRHNVELFLGQNPITFDFINTGSGLWSKDRRLAALLRRRKLEPAETAYIGDEIRDIEAARRCGVRAIAVAWGYTKPELLSGYAPDRLLRSPDELASALA